MEGGGSITKTSCVITLGLYDVSAKADAAYSTENRQPFVDLEEFNHPEGEGREVPKLATMEDNFFLLDGTFESFPDEPAEEIGYLYWSRSMSDGSGSFTSNPTVTAAFSESHTSAGLTFLFYAPTGDYPDLIAVYWYDSVGNLISAKEFAPDSPKYFAENQVEDYHKVVVEFRHTGSPYRYVRLKDLDFGLVRDFGEDQIISAKLQEGMDPVSTELSINSLDFTIRSDEGDFSLLNPQGIFKFLQQRQSLHVTEYKDGAPINIGTFYLNEWTRATDNSLSMSATDIIGLMDQTSFRGGIYEDVPADEIVREIMESAGAQYEIDRSFEEVRLSGYLPISTHREALRQAAFAMGAVVDSSRREALNIAQPSTRPSAYIPASRKFLGGTVNLGPLVTGVTVTAHSYQKNTDDKKLLDERLTAGEYEITFKEPVHSLKITGGVILESNANFAIIRVSGPGMVSLSGQGYTDNQIIIRKNMEPLPANVTPNVLEIEGATLAGAQAAGNAAERVYKHSQKRYENQFRMVGDGETMGDYIVVDSLRGEKLRGVVESINIDLAGGYLATVKLSGERIGISERYYVGELYTGEETGVL